MITPQSEKIQFASSGTLLLRRPNEIRATRTGGYADVEMFFDGKTLTVYGKNINSYTQLESPGSVDQLIDTLRGRGWALPGADLLLGNVFDTLSSDVIEAKHIGLGVIDGVECEHLAFRNQDVDWQLWVEVVAPPTALLVNPERMETVDDEIRDFAIDFMDRAKKDGKPFFVWLNPTRMHIVTHLSPKYEALRNSENGWSEEEAGMAQLDDDVGLVMKKLKDMGVDDNTIVVFTTDNGTEVFTWPDGGQTPFAQSKGTVLEGGFRVPALLRWPGHVPADSVQNGIFSGLDWLPTFVAAAGNPNITEELLKGKSIGDRTYKNHLDGYNQMDAITGKGPSGRHELFYLGESTVGAVRIDDYKYRFIDQPAGWLGEKTHPDVPYITNLRLDPFERTGWPNNGTKDGAQQYFDWFKYQFWRFVFVQQLMGKEIQTFLDYPPMQRGASFNLDAIKAEMQKKMDEAEAAAKGPSN